MNMGWIDENGIVHSVPNNPIIRMLEALIHPIGFVPLLVLIAIFFLIRHYVKNRKILMWYSIIASVLYLIILFYASLMFYRA
jgi:hypothetical protein